jgi:HK97 family phage major capsid protein
MTDKKLLEMKAKRENLRLQAVAILSKAEKEDRFLSDEENKEIKRMEAEIAGWDESIKRAESIGAITRAADNGIVEERADEPEIKPIPKTENKGFRNLGEQLMAVYRSASPGGSIDARLSTRAASGLNESNPSDGGFLVQQDFGYPCQQGEENPYKQQRERLENQQYR